MSFIGREDDVARVWEILEERSFLLTGSRRVGKTELLRHLAQAPRHGWRVVMVDLQGIDDVAGAVRAILNELEREGLGEAAWKKVVDSLEEGNLGGVQFKRTVELDGEWERLERAIDRALHLLGDVRLGLCLDEVPWWLDDVRRVAGPEAARLALARLRAIRQRRGGLQRLRMLLTGSVGLSGLAHELGASADINDLTPELALRPLGRAAGSTLFELEVTARGGQTDAVASIRAHELAGGFPHWIKMLAERARPDAEGRVAVESIDGAAAAMLAVRNRALFHDEGAEHFDRRYDRDRTKRLWAILDVAANEPRGASPEVLISASLGAGASNRKQAWADVMELIDAWILDGDDERGFRFLLPLFRLWWLKYGGEP